MYPYFSHRLEARSDKDNIIQQNEERFNRSHNLSEHDKLHHPI